MRKDPAAATLVTRRQTLEHGIAVADARSENNLTTLEHAGLGFDVDHLAVAGIDHRRFGYPQDPPLALSAERARPGTWPVRP